MKHRGKIDLKNRLLGAREAILGRAGGAIERHAARVAAGRRWKTDPRAAAEALEAIAKGKSYRLDGHTTFDAFAKAELGMSRVTASRVRAHAREGQGGEGERRTEKAAAALAKWLRGIGVRPVGVKPLRRTSWVTVVLEAGDVERVVGKGRAQKKT